MLEINLPIEAAKRLIEKYGHMKANGFEINKDNLKEVTEALREITALRIKVVGLKLETTKSYRKEISEINSKVAGFIATLKDLEDPIKENRRGFMAKMKEFRAAKKAAKEAKIKEFESNYNTLLETYAVLKGATSSEVLALVNQLRMEPLNKGIYGHRLKDVKAISKQLRDDLNASLAKILSEEASKSVEVEEAEKEVKPIEVAIQVKPEHVEIINPPEPVKVRKTRDKVTSDIVKFQAFWNETMIAIDDSLPEMETGAGKKINNILIDEITSVHKRINEYIDSVIENIGNIQ